MNSHPILAALFYLSGTILVGTNQTVDYTVQTQPVTTANAVPLLQYASTYSPNLVEETVIYN